MPSFSRYFPLPVLFALVSTAAAFAEPAASAVARVETVNDTCSGRKIVDPYRGMENDKDRD
jgi:hypothetical protein